MLADSKYCLTLLLLNNTNEAHRLDILGHFLCPPYKGGGVSRGVKNSSLVSRFSSVNATALFVGYNLNNFVMLNELTPSASSSQPIQATIDKLLLTDNLDELRHRLSRDFMLLLAEEPDEMERNRMLSDFNTLDMILETIEKERK